MARSRTCYPLLTQALPASDPMAKLAARALVLFGDLLMEWHGLRQAESDLSSAPSKHCLHAGHRQLYWGRGSLRTLYSGQLLLNNLWAEAQFQAWMENDLEEGPHFKSAKARFDKSYRMISNLRNRIGAHAEEHVAAALEHFIEGDRSSIEVHSEDWLRPHLAEDIIVATIMNAPMKRENGAKLAKIYENIIVATRELLKALSAFLTMYAAHYPLLPGHMPVPTNPSSLRASGKP